MMLKRRNLIFLVGDILDAGAFSAPDFLLLKAGADYGVVYVVYQRKLYIGATMQKLLKDLFA
jgi:hypothetical protein